MGKDLQIWFLTLCIKCHTQKILLFSHMSRVKDAGSSVLGFSHVNLTYGGKVNTLKKLHLIK